MAVGFMAVLQLYDWLLERDLERIDPRAVVDAAPALARKFAEIETLFDDPRIIERAREDVACALIVEAEQPLSDRHAEQEQRRESGEHAPHSSALGSR